MLAEDLARLIRLANMLERVAAYREVVIRHAVGAECINRIHVAGKALQNRWALGLVYRRPIQHINRFPAWFAENIGAVRGDAIKSSVLGP